MMRKQVQSEVRLIQLPIKGCLQMGRLQELLLHRLCFGLRKRQDLVRRLLRRLRLTLSEVCTHNYQ